MRRLLCVLPLLVPVFDDRPPLSDVGRFPNAGAIRNALESAEQYRWYLQARRNILLGCHVLQAAQVEATWCREAWYTLSVAEGYTRIKLFPEDGEYHGRSALARLRDYIGPDAYYRGEMPPPVPLWRFEMVR